MSSWQEQKDEDGNIYYLNTDTGESSWTNPNENSQEGCWIEQDDGEGNIYYYHTGTYESRWDRPPEMDALETAKAVQNSQETGTEPAEASEVSVSTTAKSLDELDSNSEKKEMEMENEHEKGNNEGDTKDDAKVQSSSQNNESTSQDEAITRETVSTEPPSTSSENVEKDPNGSEWYECADESGQIYYYNEITGDCTWEKPAEFDSQALSTRPKSRELEDKMKKAFEGNLKLLDKDVQQKLDDARKVHEEAAKKRDEIVAAGGELWVEVYDPESDGFYYYGSYSGEVTWETPESYVMAADDEFMASVIKIQCAFRSRIARRVVMEQREKNQKSAVNDQPKEPLHEGVAVVVVNDSAEDKVQGENVEFEDGDKETLIAEREEMVVGSTNDMEEECKEQEAESNDVPVDQSLEIKPEGDESSSKDNEKTEEEEEESMYARRPESPQQFMKNVLDGKVKLVDREMNEKVSEAEKQHQYLLEKQQEDIESGAELWVEVYDPESDAFYYYGSYTGEVTWDQPENYVMAADNELMSAVIKIQCAYRSRMARRKVTGKLQQKKNLWIESKDDETGELQYYNTQSGEFRAEKPEDFRMGGLLDESMAEKMNLALEGRTKKVNTETAQKVQKAQALARELEDQADRIWVSVYDPKSEAFYYYDAETQETTWKKPEHFVESADDETMTAVITIQCAFRKKLARSKLEQQRKQSLEKASSAKEAEEVEAKHKQMEIRMGDEKKLGDSKTTSQERALEEAKRLKEQLANEQERLQQEMEEVQRKKEENKRLALEKMKEEEEERKRKSMEEEIARRSMQHAQRREIEEREREERLKRKRDQHEKSKQLKQQALLDFERRKKEEQENIAAREQYEIQQRQIERARQQAQREEQKERVTRERVLEVERLNGIYAESFRRFDEDLSAIEARKELWRTKRQETIKMREDARANLENALRAEGGEVVGGKAWHILQQGQQGMKRGEAVTYLKELQSKDVFVEQKYKMRERALAQRVVVLRENLSNQENGDIQTDDDHRETTGNFQTNDSNKELCHKQELVGRIEYLERALGIPLEKYRTQFESLSDGELQQALVTWHNDESDTLLHVASFKGSFEAVQYLVSIGADPNRIDSTVNHWTALYEAIHGDNSAIVMFLLESGARVNLVDSSGETPLHVASRMGSSKIVSAILEAENGLETVLWKNHKHRKAVDIATNGSTRQILMACEKSLLQREQEQIEIQQKEELKAKLYRKKQKKGMNSLTRHIKGIRSLGLSVQPVPSGGTM